MTEVAAADGVVGDELGDGPVRIAEVRLHQPLVRHAGLAHRRRLQADLEHDIVEGAAPRGWPASRGRARAAADPAARSKGTRNGASASGVTTQGEIVVAKFFERKGPSGWYSQACTSRAPTSR